MQTLDDVILRLDAVRERDTWTMGDPYVVTFAQEYGEPLYTLRIGGVGCMPQGDICAIKAKAKNGKTTLMGIFIAAILGGHQGHIEGVLEQPSVLYFDTEQNIHNTAKNAKRTAWMAGRDTRKDEAGFRIYNVRTMPKEQRAAYIEQQIIEQQPTHVFIDGVRDLMNDFNDIAESGALIETLTTWTSKYNIALVAVLHENKSKEDTNMRGHLGTELVNKCSDVFKVEKDAKDKTRFCVSQTDSRNSPVDDFAIRWTEDGRVTVEENGSAPIYSAETFRKLLAEGPRGYRELVKDYAQAMGCASRTASYHIERAWKDGVLDNDLGSYSYVNPERK